MWMCVWRDILLLHTNSPIIVRFSPRITYIPTRFSQYRLSTTTHQQQNKLLNESHRCWRTSKHAHASFVVFAYQLSFVRTYLPTQCSKSDRTCATHPLDYDHHEELPTTASVCVCVCVHKCHIIVLGRATTVNDTPPTKQSNTTKATHASTEQNITKQKAKRETNTQQM